jgi:hypothetical protein
MPLGTSQGDCLIGESEKTENRKGKLFRFDGLFKG